MWGAKKDAAYGLKSTRRPRCLCVSTTYYQECPGNLIVDVFFSGSADFWRLTDWVVVVGLVFLVFFGIKGYEFLRFDLFDKCIAGPDQTASGVILSSSHYCGEPRNRTRQR